MQPTETCVTTPQTNRYEILDCIGQGHHGQVFHAIHLASQQHVALKFLDPLHFPTHRFLRELNCLVTLHHPNILSCYGLEHLNSGRYLVMGYCPKGNLRQWMYKTWDLTQKLILVRDILRGLDYAHTQGIVHCDIKPENILIDGNQQGYRARIADFGIARIRHSLPERGPSSYTGSPAYMAPERYYGNYSYASDLYSVGIILFELINGYRPFQGTPGQIMKAHINEYIMMPESVPFLVKSVLSRALSKLPQRRFSSAAEMLKAIELCEAAVQDISSP